MTEEKRKTSAFLPYCRRNGEILFFLQRRTEDAPTWPGYLGFFGGGLEEGETWEQGLIREVQEELDYHPTRPEFVGIFDKGRVLQAVFIEEVAEDFASHVTVLEGQYGRFYSMEDLACEEKVTDKNREIWKEVERRVTRSSTC